MSSLPFELQQLSLSAPSQPPAPAPTPATAPPSCVQTSSTLRLLEDRPSWMLAPPSSAYPYPPLMTPSHKRRGRPSGASHGRSMSDFYLSHPLTPRPTPLSPYHSPSSLYYPRQEQLPTPPTPSALLLSSSSSKPSFQKHRRTVSANPPRTLSVPPLPPPPPQEAAAAAAAAAAAPEKETMTLLVPMDSGARAQTQSPPSYDVPFQQQQELLHEALNMTSSSKAPPFPERRERGPTRCGVGERETSRGRGRGEGEGEGGEEA
ncbi:hypothetical protein BDF20DRAFT_664318 [Mycotypha africana]|uniref:uncharacterized protein n=1 Tax=Mycotypha africana TaxID=64632 RepID=UPI0023018447|nr:uncharacterized protein BDF20DRAFT_664318 [Mycotypha africana]KAI8973663.1 hypothetical protein BDF20DRAFT_664318 [Mycotypha africana]